MKKILFLFSLLSATLFTANLALAQQATTTSAPKETTCERVSKRVQDRVNKYTEQTRIHDERFVRLTSSLGSISAKLKAKGLDTAALDGQIQNLGAKKEKILVDKAVFIAKMNEVKEVACSAAPAKLKTTLAEAKTAQQAVVTDAKDFQGIVKTIRASIAALRGQLSAVVATSTSR